MFSSLEYIRDVKHGSQTTAEKGKGTSIHADPTENSQ